MLRIRATVLAILSMFCLAAAPLFAGTAGEIAPQAGPPGARFVIAGSSLDTGSLTISFMSASMPAQIVSRSATLVEGVVPSNAATGSVQVVQDGTTIGSFGFTVTPAPAFSRVVTLVASNNAHDVLKSPADVAVIASTGTVVVADRLHHRIVTVVANSTPSVLAGSGRPGLTDASGQSAQFKEPQGLAVDDVHQLIYVADTGNHVIRRVTFAGVVSTLAGSGRPDDTDGTGTQASFRAPAGLALDTDGNIYVADTGNSKIRIVSPSGVVHTIAGAGRPGLADGAVLQALFKQPEGIAVGPQGTIYVSDTQNNVIRALANGFVTTIAGTSHAGFVDAPAAAAEFKWPSQLALDDLGNLLVADAGNNAVRRLSLGNASSVVTIAGSPHAGYFDGATATALFNGAEGVAAWGGAAVVGDTQNDAVRAIYESPDVSAVWPIRGPSSGGNLVRIFGTGFMEGVTAVSVAGTPATDVAVISATEITATAPPGNGDLVAVTVTTPGGTATLPSAYSYVPPPTITSVAPVKGPLAGGTIVTILGLDFLDGGDTHVAFSGVDAPSVTFVSTNKILATTPPGIPASVDVTVTTPGGSAKLSAAFTYFPPPTLTNFSPSSGRAGTLVTITGTNFDPAAQDNLVQFGGTPAVVTSATSAQLVVTVPSGASTAPITVATVGGSAVSTANFQIVTYVSLVISPDSVSLDAGTTLQLSARGVAPDGSTSDVTGQAVWTSTNASVATVSSSGVLSGVTAGSVSVTAALGSLSKSVTVTVQPVVPLPPDPKTVATPVNQHSIAPFGDGVKFLFAGASPIQTGVTPGVISAERIAVLRGRVTKRGGAPLSGVTVRVLGHGELGQTLSRADGVFDMAVNGGGSVTLVYEKSGYLSAQRTVDVPWQDFTWAPDVALIPLDTSVTAVDLTSPRLQVARGSVATDADGTRQATLLFPAGTTASLQMPDGSTQPVTSLNIRATEYTVGSDGPQAMPGTLTPAIAYTWCVDLHADEATTAGATSVLFTKPVSVYLENFLQFPVGTHVPVASYDDRKAEWMPSRDARVIRIVSVTSGLADLDTNGDGIADGATTLAQLGIDSNERQQIASLYAVGQSIWRFQAAHFTAWDVNAAIMSGAAFGVDGQVAAPSIGVSTSKHLNDCCTSQGSIIEVENQTVGEAVPITGSPFALVYNSGRVVGRSANRSFDLSINQLPSIALGSTAQVQIAGTTQTVESPTIAAQTMQFDWNGRDAYDRIVPGGVTARVTVTANYPLQYATPPPPTNDMSWGRLPSVRITSSARGSFVIAASTGGFAVLGDAHTAGENGWMLDVEQHYDPATRTVYNGGGSQRTAADASDAIIRRVAGTGNCCYSGDGGPAINANLNFPGGVKIAPDGTIYLAEPCRVRMIAPDGTIQTVAGDGTCHYSGDGGPATAAEVNIADVAIGPDGAVYIADFSNRLRMVRNGIITTIAGNGTCCGGDDGLAINARVQPWGVAVGNDGTIYFSENSFGNSVIRRITPDGIISLYARASSTRGLSFGADGALYFTDSSFGQVFRIRKDGSYDFVAGRGGCSTSSAPGDGGQATDACLHTPWFATADAGGTIYIAERDGARVRAISQDGVIRTIAGNGQSRPAVLKDMLPATSSVTDGPFGIAVHPNGMVYFSDWDLDVIWRIESKLPGRSLASSLLVPSEDGSTVSEFNVGQHLRTVDALTGATLLSFGRDSDGRLTTVTDVDGNVTTLERDAAGDLTGVTAPNGQQTQVTAPGGAITRITDPAGGVYQFQYYGDDLMKTMTTPGGRTTSFFYDTQGKLTRDADAAGGFQTLTRTGTNKHYIANRSTAEGQTATYEVEYLADGSVKRTNVSPTGQLTRDNTSANGQRSRTAPDGSTSSVTLGADPRFGMAAPVATTTTVANGSLVLTQTSSRQATLLDPADILSLATLSTTTSLNGTIWQTTWTTANRTMVTRSPAGRTFTTTLDAHGRPVSTQVPGLTATSMVYDPLGRVQAMSQGGRTMTFGYDTHRYLSSVTDPLHRTTTFQRDALGQVTSQTLPGGRTILFGYDTDGNLTSVTPPSRPAHAFTVTPVGLMATYTPPAIAGAGATLYSYNRDRQLTAVGRPDGQTVSFGYDRGRLATVTTPSDAYQFGYDGVSGLLTTARFANGASLAYTLNGALPASVTWSGGLAGSVVFTYDSQFRLASENGVSFTYDADGLLASAGALTYARDPLTGFLSGSTLGQVTDAFSYNEFGEVMSYSAAFNGAPLYHEDVVRDDAGRIIGRSETTLGADSSDSYDYDDAGRLRASTRSGLTTTYGYDGNGNRITRATSSSVDSMTYDDQDRLLTRGSTGYTYTANGELQSKTDATGVTRFEYDVMSNLRHVSMPNGQAIDYVIDAQNRRVGKRVNGALVAGWLYADQLRIVAELDGTGATVSRFVYGSRLNVPDYMIRGGVTYRIISDKRGSPRIVVDVASGTIAESLGYDEFGNVLGDTNPGFQPFGFAGGLYDSDTRLVRFGARDYDPQVGRWTTKDPLGFDGNDSNLYEYAFSDPVDYVDPSGLDALTNDPHALSIMASLFRKAGSGLKDTERAAYILQDPSTGKYLCFNLPFSAEHHKESFPKWKHPWAVALIHSHPIGGVEVANDPGDSKAAESLSITSYVVSRGGVHKYVPPAGAKAKAGSGQETLEVDNRTYFQQNKANWYDYTDADSCGCN
jgi:RHS repeat-associated protein